MSQLLFVLLLLIFAVSPIEATTKKITRVLVLGGTGRVGSAVVSKLLSQGIETRVLARNKAAASKNEKLRGSSIIEGNVLNIDDILHASTGCSAIISAHGVRPTRFFKLRDLYKHPKSDDSHPYNVNFLATKRIIAAMQINKIDKLVRITGALVDKSPFLPFVYLFNLLLSKTIKWHEASEIAIRASGLDYTVIRPTEITETVNLGQEKSSPNDGVAPTKLVLLAGDSGKSAKLPGEISIDNVADLCVKSVLDERLQGACSKTTLIVNTEVGEGPSTIDAALDATPPVADSKLLKPRRHNMVMVIYSTALLASPFIYSMLGSLVDKSVSLIYRIGLPLLPRMQALFGRPI